MNDKQWLERVTIAYKTYSQQKGSHSSVEDFITWLYQQYGIIEPNKGKK